MLACLVCRISYESPNSIAVFDTEDSVNLKASLVQTLENRLNVLLKIKDASETSPISDGITRISGDTIGKLSVLNNS